MSLLTRRTGVCVASLLVPTLLTVNVAVPFALGTSTESGADSSDVVQEEPPAQQDSTPDTPPDTVADPPVTDDPKSESVTDDPELQSVPTPTLSEDLTNDQSQSGEQPQPLEALPNFVLNFADAPAIARGNSRVGGHDRFETAVAISQRLFPNGKAPAVFLASGSAYADGLAVGALATFKGGPLLLTPSSALPPSVAAEIQRLGTPTVFIAGGTAAVPDEVENEVRALGARTVRLAGTDRYATAQRIAAEFPVGSVAMIATGTEFPDALVASASSSKAGGGPLLLSRGFTYTQDLGDALSRLKPSKTILVGGKWTSDAINALTAASGTTPTSVSGIDRYETAVNLAKLLWPTKPTRYIYATGLDFADAMAAVPISRANDAPLVLTRTNCRPEVLDNYANNQVGVLLVGGEGALGKAAYYEKCVYVPLPPNVTIDANGYYRFNMSWSAQENGYYCGPATGEMILRMKGYSVSSSGKALSQSNLARPEFMATDKYERTSFADGKVKVGVQAWTGNKFTYKQTQSPSVEQFQDAITRSFTVTGWPVVVDTQEWAWRAHYNGHPAYSEFSHLMPVEGYNPKTGKIILLDPASFYYAGSSRAFEYNLGAFQQFLSPYGIYY